MRILYVSGMPLPIENILKGKEKVEGFPAFYFPMRKLLSRGHELRFILLSNFPGPYDVQVDWFESDFIVANIAMKHSERGGIYRLLRQVVRGTQFAVALWKEVSKENYDLIYAHGPIPAVVAQAIGQIRNIPVGVRWYGDTDMCLPDIKRSGAFRAAMRHPGHFANFRLRYSFFLATDDNTGVNEIYEAWRAKKTPGPFYHWRTGIEFKDELPETLDHPIPIEAYIFHAARFSPRKRQDRVVETLRALHDRGLIFHLYLAGQLEGGPSSVSYVDEIKALVRKLELEEYVHFLGGVSQDTVRAFAHSSAATLIMQDHSNLGNFFYEAMSSGAILVVTDDGAVSQFIRDGESGFIVSNPREAADVVEQAYADSALAASLREQSRATAERLFLSADERFDKEVELIETIC